MPPYWVTFNWALVGFHLNNFFYASLLSGFCNTEVLYIYPPCMPCYKGVTWHCSSINILFIDSIVSPPFSCKTPAVLCHWWKRLSIRDYSKHQSFHLFLSLKIFIAVPWKSSFYHKIKDPQIKNRDYLFPAAVLLLHWFT